MFPAFERVYVDTPVRAGEYLAQEKVLPEVSTGWLAWYSTGQFSGQLTRA